MKPKLGRSIGQLHGALVELADDFRKVGERHAVEHDVFHLSHSLALQCEGQANALRRYGERYEHSLRPVSEDGVWDGLLAKVRRANATLVGRLPVTGVLLLRDLRQLHLSLQEVAVLWLVVGQAAQANRDAELLTLAEQSRQELTHQIIWVTTRIKETAPQALLT